MGSTELLEIDNSGYAYSPHLALDSSGNAFAVWEQDDGTRSNIWSSRFE
ncbi:MAG: hypothetical protein KUG82_19675 [Pseudomonadales bacterium]|nr:hypothetical protein [Pseudomonadales bacterium]